MNSAEDIASSILSVISIEGFGGIEFGITGKANIFLLMKTLTFSNLYLNPT